MFPKLPHPALPHCNPLPATARKPGDKWASLRWQRDVGSEKGGRSRSERGSDICLRDQRGHLANGPSHPLPQPRLRGWLQSHLHSLPPTEDLHCCFCISSPILILGGLGTHLDKQIPWPRIFWTMSHVSLASSYPCFTLCTLRPHAVPHLRSLGILASDHSFSIF